MNRETDAIEALVRDSLAALDLTGGLDARIAAALPAHGEMRPAVHPALRIVFGLTAVFTASGWAVGLPGWFGARGAVGGVCFGAMVLAAAVGAGAIGVTLFRDAGGESAAALRALLQGPRAKGLLATAGAAVVFGAIWVFMGWFPGDMFREGLRAARASAATAVLVLLAVSAIQLSLIARGRDWRPAFRLVEAVGLLIAGIACAANYVIFVA